MELTVEKRMIIIFGIQARINELEKRIENYEWYLANKENVEHKTEMQQGLVDVKKELAETITLLREMEAMRWNVNTLKLG